MSARPLIAPAALTVLIAACLAGCATLEPQPPSPSAAVPSATPAAGRSTSPMPTPTALVVGPGDRPPALFSGECNQMLSPEDVVAVLGRAGTLDTAEQWSEYDVFAAAGG